MTVLQIEGVTVHLELVTELFFPLDVLVYQLKPQIFDNLEFLSEEA